MKSMFDLKALTSTIEGVSGQILDYALVLAAVGTIAMALIELIKAVTRGRLFFHRLMINRWVGGSESVRNELLALAAGGRENANALYDQPSEKMLGQIQAAANVALDFPTVYPVFYAFLTAGSAAVGGIADRDKWSRFAPRMAQGIPTEAMAKIQFEADSRDSTQARARLGNLVTRRLDALQTRIGYFWARLNQTVAVVGGAALLYYALPGVAKTTPVPTPVPLFTRFVLAVIGGLIAPFAKDVVSKLSGLQVRR